MQHAVTGVFGASGYSGVELTRLLSGHRHLEVRFLTSDRWLGQTAGARVGVLGALPYLTVEQGLEASAHCDVVFLATPAATSLELGPTLRAQGVRVVDLAGAFRLKDPTQYPAFYGFAHREPALLAEAVYGLPELFRAQVKGARYVANPGCYATAAALAVAPLLRAGLVEPSSLVINAASGVSGAGRKASEELTFMEVEADFRAYKTLKHQHTPEIAQTLSVVAGEQVEPVFTPHLLPMKRGILCTAVATLRPGVSQRQIDAAFADAYASERFIRLLSGPDEVRIADVAQTPRCLVGVASERRRVVAISALDNLLKGAASQAVQNLNLLCGFSETEGLDAMGKA